MIAAYSRWVVDHPRLTIFIPLLLSLALALGIASLEFRSDHRIFFGEENEDLLSFETVENTYTKSDNIVFLVTAKQGDVFRADTLDVLLELTKQAWAMPYIKRVDSIVNFQNITSVGDDVTIDNVLREQDPKTDEAIRRVRDAVLGEPLLVNRLINPDGTVTGVAARFQIADTDKDAAVPEIMEAARRIAASMQQRWPGIELRLTGSVPMDYAFVEASERDLSTLTPAMLVIITVLIAVLLGSPTGALMTLVVILLSIVGSMGIAGFLGIPLSPPSATAPNIIMTLATADCVHLIWGTMRRLYEGVPKKKAVEATLTEDFAAIFHTSVTTFIGFLSMNFSESPPFQHLGNITAIGVVIAWVLSVTILPATMVLLPMRPRASSGRMTRISERLFDWISVRPAKVMWTTLAAGLVLSAFAFTNKLDDRFVEYFDDSFAFRRDTDYMAERLTGIYYIDFSLKQPESNGIADPVYLAEIESFANWFRAQPEVVHVEVLTDILKKINLVMNTDQLRGNDSADADYHVAENRGLAVRDVAVSSSRGVRQGGGYVLPESRAVAAQYLLLYEMSLPHGLDLKDRITVDKSATRMTVSLKNVSTGSVLALLDRAETWAADHLKVVEAPKGTGTTVVFSHIGMRNIRDMIDGTVWSVVSISLLLFFLFRSLTAGFIGLFTNTVPSLMVLGAWALLVGEVGMAVAVIASMTLGIVVDDTIHFVDRYLHARRVLGETATAAVRHAMVQTGPAVFTSTVVLASGFFCLAFSGFQINSWIGLMTAINILVAAVFDLFLLPTMLILIGGRK